jgi:hypothetical protein
MEEGGDNMKKLTKILMCSALAMVLGFGMAIQQTQNVKASGIVVPLGSCYGDYSNGYEIVPCA